MAASKKTASLSRYRRSRKNGCLDSRKPHPKSSVEYSSSVRTPRHYPAYFTVDDLAAYRRRRFFDRVHRDNLRPLSGKFAHLKSEYRRRFKSYIVAADESSAGTLVKTWKKKEQTARTEDDQRTPAAVEQQQQQDKEDAKAVEFEQPTPPSSTDQPHSDDERVPSFIMFNEARRPALVRRPTNLKIGGDFRDATENKDQFREPGRTQRATMFRRGTTLKLEGDMNLSTELRDRYKRYEQPAAESSRSTLVRRLTNLRANSGSMDSLTEYDSSYATPALTERPPLVRSMENLHVEGEVDFDPEYRRNYVDYRANYPDIIFKGRKMETRPHYPAANKSNPLADCHVKELLVDASLKDDLFSPEYRRAYVPMELPQRSNFKRPRTHLMPAFGIGEKESELNAKYKPFLNVERTKNLRPSTHLHAEGKMECRPEYRASFVDFAEQREKQECCEQQWNGTKSNRSAGFKKGKRLPSGRTDSESTASAKPAFRLEVTNPDQVRKPFEMLRVDDSRAFVVLDENNNNRRNKGGKFLAYPVMDASTRTTKDTKERVKRISGYKTYQV